jgi:hypothetical protein
LDATEHRNLAPDVHAGLKKKLRWRLNRLRCMTPAEVGFRLRRALQAQAERARLIGCGEVPAPDLSVAGRPWVQVPAGLDPAPYVAAADRIGEGRLDVFALRDIDVGDPPRWNRDPKTGIEAPLAFGKTLDYRDPDLVGDIKYLWEPNRHLHLVTLAQAYALTGSVRYLHTMAEHLESWFIACPFGRGPNWASSLEAAIRLINWAIAWQLIGARDARVFEASYGAELRARWVRSVYQHAEFIGGWLSLHSSANNHLIGEAAALFLAGLSWPHWPRSRAWVANGKRILERESLAQNAPDGVNREQAVAYQQFVLDFQLYCLLAGKANGQWFSADYESRIEAMLDYLASIMDAGGNVPQFGDADDGYVARLSQEAAFCPYRSLLTTGAVLFSRGDFKHKAGRLDDKTRWLLGTDAARQFAEIDEQTSLPPRQTFPEGGYYVLGAELETEEEIRLVADAGPLGYRSIAAHGHADALSFTLSAGGLEFLVDPGTYAYHTQAAWREYFRGTSAHNTVRIDHCDQSVSGGNFMWVRKAKAGCSLWLSSATKDSFEGWHDGYLRLPDPVRHRRLIELDKPARRVLVEDTLEMAQAHEVELFFHCHEDARVIDQADGGFLVSRGERTIRLVLPQHEGARVEVYRGSLAPLLGWVSRAFDSRTPSSTIAWHARLAGRTVLRSEILIL